MAFPTLQKTWQGGTTPGGTDLVNQTITVGSPRDTLFAIKEALVNMDQNPWTVIGSSDSIASGMDAVDRWVTAANLVYRNNSNDPMSWIVLQNTALGATFQMVLSLEDTLAADPQRENINIAFSKTGYGVANGGTDGATNSSPTSDGTRSFGLDCTNWHGAENGTDTDKVLSVIMSTDAEVTRLVISQKSSGQALTSIGIEKPRLPNSLWTTPVVGYILKETAASGNNCFRWETIQNAEPFKARVVNMDSVNIAVDMRFVGPMKNTTEVIDENQDTTALYFYGGSLVYDGLFAHQNWGSLFDFYWVSRATGGAHAANLDSFPAAGNRTFVCVGDVVWGWLDDSTTDLSYT